MRRIDYQRLSKTVSHALRHEPWVYGLELDEEGWANVQDLLEGLRKHQKWQGLTIADIQEMNLSASKQRFEISEDRIRALYGHSFDQKIKKEPATPPEFLYHGATPEIQIRIMENGLSSMGRQYVHLSMTREDVWEVGRRKSNLPVVLTIHAKEAHEDGIHFYHGNKEIWLADEVPAAYISVEEGAGN